MRIVKQRLLELMPDLQCFLDVDDLEEIGDRATFGLDPPAVGSLTLAPPRVPCRPSLLTILSPGRHSPFV